MVRLQPTSASKRNLVVNIKQQLRSICPEFLTLLPSLALTNFAAMVSRTIPRMAGFIFRENRVPYYQRLFQKHDGKRIWNKSHRSPYLLYPFYISLFGTFGASFYAMCRTVLGHKTWY
ncbi:hypothetical protein GX51_03645 [Blastomyces parvus]|uniref:Uncharacterized protein n=1 Tax=Blastomyces parvus TaxID=2060905 RepID=A0A2B7X639_9EURO|nr:hypothetical protein GX51_03645 [Blastomyces parvus]